MTMKKNIYVFGEIHSNRSIVNKISNRIREIKPDYLLHELLYKDKCVTKEEIASRLKECKEGGICDPSLNKDIYTLGALIDAKLIGIDLDDPEITQLSIQDQFQKRERHMKRIIKTYLELEGNPTIVIVVGDTHLRQYESPEIGPPSPLFKLLNEHPRVVLERVPRALQEMV